MERTAAVLSKINDTGNVKKINTKQCGRLFSVFIFVCVLLMIS